MSFTKITDAAVNVIRQLPNRPTGTGYMSAKQLKEKFDEAAESIKSYFNTLVNDLESTSAAASIGFARTTGVAEDTVQAAIVNVQAQIAGVSQGAVADGSITAAKLDADAFDWTEASDDPNVYSSKDYSSNGLVFYYCSPLKKMRVEGYVTFTPANEEIPYATFTLPGEVPTLGTIPLTAAVIGSTRRTDLTARAEIRQSGYLDVYLGGWKAADRGSNIRVFVHGEYYCEGE